MTNFFQVPSTTYFMATPLPRRGTAKALVPLERALAALALHLGLAHELVGFYLAVRLSLRKSSAVRARRQIVRPRRVFCLDGAAARRFGLDAQEQRP